MKNAWDDVYEGFRGRETSWELEGIDSGKPTVVPLLLECTDPCRILDIGCGRGRYYWHLKTCGYDVYGIDISVEAIRDAKATYGSSAKLLVGDASALPFLDGTFDAVIDIGAFHHVQQPKHITYLSDVSRILRAGGTFAFSAFSTDDSYCPLPQKSTVTKIGTYVYFFDEEYLRRLVEPVFDIFHIGKTEWSSKLSGRLHSAWNGLCKKR